MMSVSMGRSMMSVNPSVALWKERVRSDGLVANMFVRSRVVKLTCYVEDHCGLGGNIISRLDNGAFTGLINTLPVLMDYRDRL